MRRLGVLIRGYWLELAVIVTALAGAFEVVIRRDAANAPGITPWIGAPAIAVLVLPLAARRWRPFAAPALVWVLVGALSFVDGRLIVFTASAYAAGMLASLLLGMLPDTTKSRAGLFLLVAGSLTAAYNAPSTTPESYFFTPAFFVVLWLPGLALRRRGARAEEAELRAARLVRDREEATLAAIANERARMARELHDVLGHSLTVMTIQASAVRRALTPGQAKERDALLSVEQTGREALTEMRRLVGILRGSGETLTLEPQPGLRQVSRLVEQARETGMSVRLHVEGEPVDLPPGVDLAAYRVVQEGLTNARKHSEASLTEVSVQYGPDAIEVEVRDNGKGISAANEGGQGLIGMRERVSIFGGEFEAGPLAEGGFRLRARLPVRS